MSGTGQRINHEIAHFTVICVDGQHLKGTVEVTFTLQSKVEFVDYEDPDHLCKIDYDSGSITWTADLAGEYQKQPNGSLTVMIVATPKQGPAYTEQTCLGNDPPVHHLWLGSGGILTNGVYDKREDRPATTIGGTTGYSYTIVHMELSGQP